MTTKAIYKQLQKRQDIYKNSSQYTENPVILQKFQSHSNPKIHDVFHYFKAFPVPIK